MDVTDFITLILSTLLLLRGYARGFMHSLTGPVSVIVTTVLSIIYYETTADITISLMIGLIGPVGLNILFKFLLKTWAKSTNREIKPNISSRWGGAVLTLCWGWVFIAFTLILLNFLPPWGKKLSAIHNDVSRSGSYVIIKPLANVFFPAAQQNSQEALNENASNDAKSLAEDPRFQKVLQDPEIQKEINAHDIAGLMKNPKMMELVRQLMSDPDTMKKVMTLYGSQAMVQGN